MSYTKKEMEDMAKSFLRVKDHILTDKTFAHDGYVCEMHIWNDNQSLNKWRSRGMFGRLSVQRQATEDANGCFQQGLEDEVKFAYSLTVPMNDWDLNPKFIEHGLMGKFEAFLEQRKKCAKLKAERRAKQQKQVK